MPTQETAREPQGKIQTAEDGILAAAVEKILGEIGGLTRPFKQVALQRALDTIGTEDMEQQARDQGPRLQLSKAFGDFRPIVKWIQERTIEEKLTGLAFSILIDSDVQRALRGREVYRGDIGDDLDADWNAAVAAVLETEEGRQSVSPEVLSVASYLMGIDARSY